MTRIFCTNAARYWKLKIKMSSRRDDESVPGHAEEKQRRARFILSFPSGRNIFSSGVVARHSRTSRTLRFSRLAGRKNLHGQYSLDLCRRCYKQAFLGRLFICVGWVNSQPSVGARFTLRKQCQTNKAHILISFAPAG